MTQQPENAGALQPLWDAASVDSLRKLLSPSGRERLERFASDLRTRRWAMRAILGLAGVLLLVQGLLLPTAQWVLPRELLAYGLALAVLCLVGTLCGLTLTVREIVAYALFGFFVAPILTVLLATPGHQLLGPELGTALVVPLVEETVKVIPALLLAFSLRRDPRGGRTLYDFLIVGFASGAGFAMHEDILWERLLIADGPLLLIMPWVYTSDPYLSGSHAAWTALVAFGVGVIVLFRRRRLTWIVAIIATSVGVLEHVAWNLPGGFDLLGLLGNGRIPLIVFFVAGVSAGTHGFVVRMWGRHRDGLFPAIKPFGTSAWRNWPRRLEYSRLLTQAHSGWMRHRVFGARTAPAAPAAERLVLSAIGASVLSATEATASVQGDTPHPDVTPI